MERNREIRRASMATAAVNGRTKRRHRITLDEDPEQSLQKKKIRYNDRYRDRESVTNRKKRRRDEEESTDESFVDEEEDEEEVEDDRRIHWNRPSPSPSNSSISNQSHRRNFIPARSATKSTPATDESVIGVPVPRKARSASVKRSHENWSFGNGDRRYSPSLVTVMVGRCLSGASPSSSSSSLKKKKKKKSLGLKTMVPKVEYEIQDDIEIEVAEALFDLMKQSQSQSENSKNQEISSNINSSDKLDSASNKAIDDKSICSPMTSEQVTVKASHLAHVDGNQCAGFVHIARFEEGKNGESRKEGEVAGAVSLQNGGLIIETKEGREKDSELEVKNSLAKSEHVSLENVNGEEIKLKKEESVWEVKDSNKGAEEIISADGVMTKNEVVAPKEEESRPCVDLIADNAVDSASSKVILAKKVTEVKQETKFEIDLMAPPAMSSSVERDGLLDIASDYREVMLHDIQMKSDLAGKKEDKMLGEVRQKRKTVSISVQKGVSRVDIQVPNEQRADGSSGNKPEEPRNKKVPNECKAPISGGQKFAQPGSFPFSIAGAGWPTGLPHPAYSSSLQMVVPVDGSARSLTALQPPPFVLVQPRPRRCATHQYIARSIHLHQQLTKNSVWPAAAGPANLYEAKPYDPVLSVQNVATGGTSQGDFPGWQTLALGPGISGKDKSSRAANGVDATKDKQLMLQQALPQIPTADMLHGSALIFHLGQHHASTVPPSNQSGPPKSATALGNAVTPDNSGGGALLSSLSLPTGAAALNFNNANAIPPYMPIFQNNGYPFSFSTNIGVSPSKGGVKAPVHPLFNGSYYSSPTSDISQNQQQQSFSKSQVQTSTQNTSTSSGTKPSQVQPHGQPHLGAHVTNVPSTTMLLQQSQKQQAPSSHSSGKAIVEASQKNNGLVADSRMSHYQKSSGGQNFVLPFQPVNFAYMSPGVLGGGMGSTSSHHGEPQQQGSKGGAQFIPPQTFAFSVPSNGSATPAVNFSSIAQNPAALQMLPPMSSQYQFPPVTQMTQAGNNFQISDGKIIVGLSNNGEDRKGILGKSPVSAAQPNFSVLSTSTFTGTVYDSSGRTVSFVQSPVSGTQAFTSSSTAPTTVASANTSNSQHQHQQLIHLQKQHMQQQMQLTGTDKPKEPKSNTFPCSFIPINFSNNTPEFSQTPIQTSSLAQSSQLKNLPSSQVPSPCNISSLKVLSQEQLNNPLGQMHIAFSSGANFYTAFQGQPFVVHNLSAASFVGGSPSNHSILKDGGGASKTASSGSKTGQTSVALPSQQIETSQGTLGPKSSPVCGRNVPSILSTCPSQVSKLKH